MEGSIQKVHANNIVTGKCSENYSNFRKKTLSEIEPKIMLCAPIECSPEIYVNTNENMQDDDTRVL
jgi:hypothetical protein